MASKVIRDPIHGNIKLKEYEVSIIDTPAFQRLRHIKQNGLCYLVYPAMNSTRFEHSLGVLHLAGLISEYLGFKEDEDSLLRVAGLLHDVGHLPFSHTLDNLAATSGHSHEENASKIINDSCISDILTENGVSPKRVSNLILGKSELSKIISSEIDVDKMDYLIRDAYYAGVAYGVIDVERLVDSLKTVGGKLVVDEGGIEAVESLLISRNLMYQTVYRHHTKRIVEAMFRCAFDSMWAEGKLTYGDLCRMDDIDLMHAMRNAGGYTQDVMKRIDERRLFKRVFSEKIGAFSEASLKNLGERQREIEGEISSKLGVTEGYVLVDVPEKRLSEFKVSAHADGVLKSFDEVSALAKALEQSENEKLTVGVYTTRENIPKMKDFSLKDYV